MTNLERIAQFAISSTDADGELELITIFIKKGCENWRDEWIYDKRECALLEWLLDDSKTYKLTKFEYDFLQNYVEQFVGEKWFGTSDFCMGMKKLGYFTDISSNTYISDILENCEVID